MHHHPHARQHHRRSVQTGAALTVAAALLLAGCAGQGAARTPQDEARAAVPQALRSAGVLRVGTDLNYPPVEFRGPDGKPAGLDPDLANALGDLLGLRVEIVDTPFDKLIPGLNDKQFDIAMSALSDVPQRRDGTDDAGKPTGQAGVDFVDYFIAGTSILVPKGNPKGVRTLEDLCGTTIALQRGTTQDELLGRQAAACARLGKPLQIHRFDSDAEALAEVASGKAVAGFNDYPVAAYAAKTTDGGNRFQVAGAQSQSSPYGIATAKSETALRDVLATALNQLIRNGEYGKILAKWDIADGAAQTAVVNGGL
ncbi:ABC transporter substrate-binding protein [Kitasatospora sp. NBC_00315]|uniref:ABC transporter substrate-binding protein n=1 Tax=Kitasatospora sp. NBC_00315 TaxID=2975963 RepID=UPI00324A9F98